MEALKNPNINEINKIKSDIKYYTKAMEEFCSNENTDVGRKVELVNLYEKIIDRLKNKLNSLGSK